MTLDEAIKHCKEKAEEKRKDYEQACAYNIPSEGCLKCAEEHEQLAEWLEELKAWRELKLICAFDGYVVYAERPTITGETKQGGKQ